MIRPATLSDTQAVKELFQELIGRPLSDEDVINRMRHVQNSPIDSLFVYDLDNKIIGLLAFRIRENIEENSRFGEISVMVVKSESRKKGIGKKLMEYAEQVAHEKGCIGTWLVSGFGREEQAHLFYKGLGYKNTGYRFVNFFKEKI
jgi:N-acetylglutamate synthase-like GNAT family acetyltransferase